MPFPALTEYEYPFGLDVYPRTDLILHEPPSAIVQLILAQAELNGLEIARDAIVELRLEGGIMEGHRYVVYWPSFEAFHMLVPKRSISGRA